MKREFVINEIIIDVVIICNFLGLLYDIFEICDYSIARVEFDIVIVEFIIVI